LRQLAQPRQDSQGECLPVRDEPTPHLVELDARAVLHDLQADRPAALAELALLASSAVQCCAVRGIA
jgi:hypothetical protein